MRKYLNYIFFGLVVLVVVGAAVYHSRGIHKLVDDMGSSDPHVQSHAALELIQSEQFSDSITGESPETRLHAVSALEALGNDSTVVPDKAVKDAPNYRAQAVKQCIALLKDPEKSVREAAVKSLQRIGNSAPDNLKELVNGIGDGDTNVRKGVAQAFTDSKNGIGPKPGVVEAIVDKMKADGGTRAPGGDILSHATFRTAGANDRSVPLLLGFLTDKDDKGKLKADEGARNGAADALGKIGDPKAVQTLIESMRSDTPQVRRVAIGAIALIADPSGEKALTEALVNPNDDNEARAQAAAGLGKLASDSAISTLVKTLEDKDLKLRSAAVAALARAGRPTPSAPTNPKTLNALTAALDAPGKSTRLGAAQALQSILAQSASGPTDDAGRKANTGLIALLQNETNEVNLRAAAAEALGYPGNGEAVKPLIKALSDPHGDVGLAAKEALAHIGPTATSALIIVMQEGGTDAYYAAQAVAGQGKEALPALQLAAQDDKKPVGQRWAAVALGSLGIAEASKTLQQLAQSKDEEVAYVAKSQLERLGQAQ